MRWRLSELSSADDATFIGDLPSPRVFLCYRYEEVVDMGKGRCSVAGRIEVYSYIMEILEGVGVRADLLWELPIYSDNCICAQVW